MPKENWSKIRSILTLLPGEMNFTKISDRIDDGKKVTKEEFQFYSKICKNIDEYEKL